MYRNFSLTEKEKKDILEQHGRYGYKKPLNEQPFNSGGEPMMTQRQYNDYSEPSEPDYNDNDYYGDDDQKIVQDELKRKLEKNDILLETFDGEEFFIRCRGDNDFMIYFEGEKVKIYENGREGEKENTFNLMDAFNYIMDNKNKFHNYQESAKSRNDDFENDRRDRDHSRGEQMSEMHQSFGSPKENKYNWENPLWEELTNTNDGPINGETVILRIIELSKEGNFSDDELSDVGLQAVLMVHENSYKGSYGSGPEPMGY